VRAGERRDIRLLISGNGVSAFGNAVYLIAVTLLLKQLTDSALMLGLFQFLALSPAFFLSPLTGALIDRYSRRNIVVLSDLYRGVLMIAAGAAMTIPALRSAWLILPVSLLAGIGHALFVPAAHALIPSIVSRDQLRTATGLRAASSQMANLGGNAAGGALFALLGAPVLFLVNGVTFILSAVQELFIRAGGHGAPHLRNEGVMALARQGLRVVFRDSRLPYLILSQAGLFLVSPVLILALPFIVLDELALPEAVVGLFFAAAILGGLVAFALLRTTRAERMLNLPLVGVAYLLLGAAFTALSFSIHPITLSIVALISGAAAATVYLFATTWIQLRTEKDIHGRLFAVLEAASAFVAPISYLIMGALLETLGEEWRWTLFAAVAASGLIWAAVLLGRWLRRAAAAPRPPR
jgi:MFS family permease